MQIFSRISPLKSMHLYCVCNAYNDTFQLLLPISSKKLKLTNTRWSALFPFKGIVIYNENVKCIFKESHINGGIIRVLSQTAGLGRLHCLCAGLCFRGLWSSCKVVILSLSRFKSLQRVLGPRFHLIAIYHWTLESHRLHSPKIKGWSWELSGTPHICVS